VAPEQQRRGYPAFRAHWRAQPKPMTVPAGAGTQNRAALLDPVEMRRPPTPFPRLLEFRLFVNRRRLDVAVLVTAGDAARLLHGAPGDTLVERGKVTAAVTA
jgi:hypothetical protein